MTPTDAQIAEYKERRARAAAAPVMLLDRYNANPGVDPLPLPDHRHQS